MTKQFLVVLIVVVAAIGIALLVVSTFMTKLSRDKNSEPSQALLQTKAGYSVFNNIFNVLNSIAIFKHFQDNIYNRYNILFPDAERQCKEKTVKLELVIFGLAVVVITTMAILSPDLYGLLLAMWTVYIGASEIMETSMDKVNNKLLAQFSKLVSEMRHAFVMNNMVDEALAETYDHLDPLILGHAMQMHRILVSDDQEEAIFKYSRTCPSKYMLQFLSICAITMRYGDRKVHDQSLFLLDIKDLKQSLEDDLLSRNLRKSKFMALIPISVIPVFILGVIRSWAVETMPMLQRFYMGSTGVLLEIACFAISFVVYKIISTMKKPVVADNAERLVLKNLTKIKPIKRFVENYEFKYAHKTYKINKLLKNTGSSYNTQTFLLHRLSMGVVGFVLMFGLIVGLNMNTRNLESKEFSNAQYKYDVEAESAAAFVMTVHYMNLLKGEDIPALSEGFTTTPEEWDMTEMPDLRQAWLGSMIREKGLQCTDEELIEYLHLYNKYFSGDSKLYITQLGTSGGIPKFDDPVTEFYFNDDFKKVKGFLEPDAMQNPAHYLEIAKNALSHVDKYQNAYFKWYYIIFMIFAALFGYEFPYVSRRIRFNSLQEVMEDEVIQFQGIILILMYIDNMSVQTILEEICKFAKIFQESIQTCIGDFTTGDMEALQALYDAETYEPFRRIVQNFMMCDKIGIRAAFDETEVERKNAVEKRAQDRSISLDKKAALANFFSMIPFSASIAAYWAYPFIAEGMSTMTSSLSGL